MLHLRYTVRSAAVASLAAALFACAEPADDDDDDLPPGPATATVGEGGKADGPELRVRAGEMTLWVDRIAVASRDGGEPVAIIEGRASRNLAAVSSWVPDDSFGQATLRTKRTFEIELRGGHEVNTLLSGLPIFVSLDSTTGSITHYEGKIVLAPRFAAFEGSSELFVDAAVAPVWAGTAEDPLRYHGRVSTTAGADSLTVEAAEDAAPVVSRTGELTWNLAWTYAPLERAAIPATDSVTFTASIAGRTVSKEASVELQVVEIGLTTLDPREVWPTSCERAVNDCIGAAGEVEDLSACGTYRQVSACRFGDPCEIDGPQPLSLVPTDVSSSDDEAAAYSDGCGSGGDWCSLAAVRGFTLPDCLESAVTLEAIFEEVRQLDQDHSGLEFSFGNVLDRAGVAATPFFSSTYSDGGPALFGALDAIAGDVQIEAWSVSQQVPCHNCTDFQDTVILFYPLTGFVFVVDGGHGFDS